MTMKTISKTITRSVEMLNGEKVEREAKLTINKPESHEEAVAAFGEDLWKWAYHGYLAYAQQIVRMKLGGGDLDGRSNKLLRQFRESVRVFVSTLDMTPDEAVKTLMSKTDKEGKLKFAELQEYFNSLSDAGVKQFDFTTTKLQTPRWFDPDGENESEDEEETEETK